MFTPAPGVVIADRYALIEEIGRGGMGSVWKAQHRGLGTALALKFMLGGRGQDASARGRFLSEARAAARVQSPYVARVFDVDEWDGVPYIAMEFLEGETLDARVERLGALSPVLTCTIVDQVALGLSRAHAERLVHRDLKPSNVFLVRQRLGEPLLTKVLDFGLAKQLDVEGPHATQSGMLLGTPGYMSPEQALGPRVVDERADLWSLAAITYYCLTGKEPFPGEALAGILLQVVHGPLPIPSQSNPALDAAFDAWWQRAAHRDPAARPRSALSLAKELRSALGLALPAVPGDELEAIALASTELADVRPVSPDPATTRAGAGVRAAVTIPSHAVVSLSVGDSTDAATAVRAVAVPAAPEKARPDTLQPASKLPLHRGDGLPLYALVAVGFAALGAGGFSYWSRDRAAPADDTPARASEAAPAARANAELPPSPEAPHAPASAPEAAPDPAASTPNSATSTPDTVPENQPAAPAAPPSQATTIEAHREPASVASGGSGPRPAEARPERLAPAKARTRGSAAATRRASNASEPPAPPPASEKKHERLGF